MKSVMVMQCVDSARNSDKVYVAMYDGINIIAYWGRRGMGWSGKNNMMGTDADYSNLVFSKLKKGYVEITDSVLLKNIGNAID